MQVSIKKSWLYFPLTASFFGLALVIDQLLLPMFHFMGFPYKVSYFFVSLWFLDFLIKNKRDIYIDREFKLFCLATFIIIIFGTLGELFFSIYWTVDSYEPFIRSNLIYVLTVFSFGLGLASSRFDIKWLFSIILISISLNFVFIFLKLQVPTFLIDLYYGKEVIDDFEDLGLDSVEAILELTRPRGLFPNPNGSAFLVNIISLFIYLGIKHKLCAVPSLIVYVLVILLPIALSGLLASRGEFIVAVILAVLHFRTLKLSKKINFVVLVSVMILTALLFSASFIQKIDTSNMTSNLERVLSIVKVVDNASSKDSDVKALSSVARPLMTLVSAYERFKLSPIFGTGYGRDQRHEYFKDGTDHFHNDWFRLIVTSGLVGLIAMLWIINRFVLFLGWPVLIPFVFPGMINSFLLNVPAVMFFFYMVGYMRLKLRHPRTLGL